MTRHSSTERALRAQVGRRVRTCRVWLGLSQDQVAAKAGVTRNFVSAIERGQMTLDAWRLGLVASAFGTTVGWLLDEPGTTGPSDSPPVGSAG